ncbi:TRAP transporter substrate-binding protein DctP [Azospirillum isscasi]|uniref:TRAP transporter substrate-binding protein DctP n=1 Tax=Azospirillum isscasi TaxID=3053926 RepID=A0ABU0WGV8_9PROT|nr:TRAP transporter substrate-binding protein DctP [Azospirillum isscasi]MDQ2103391.1 TRAP transporter substrate-binding protein DctP [Azospirillum isscasi]
MQPIAWRISVENNPGHIQVQVIERFARRFEDLSGGRVSVRLFDSARLYRDVDLPRVLSNDRIEMGVPGVWQLDRYVPDFGLFLLPLFYGRTPDRNHAVVDGPVGQALGNALASRLNVVVPGRWIDLGPAHIFTFDHPIRNSGDFAGLRLRVAGGFANEMRLQRLGATAVRVAWPDLSEAVDRGNLDGLLTSYVTVESAPFASRLRYVYEDSAYFPQYVPLVSRAAWRRLGPELRDLFLRAWEGGVDDARAAAAAAQAEARRRLVARGLTVVHPTPAEIDANRAMLDSVQDDIIAATRITPSMVGGLQYLFEDGEVDP